MSTETVVNDEIELDLDSELLDIEEPEIKLDDDEEQESEAENETNETNEAEEETESDEDEQEDESDGGVKPNPVRQLRTVNRELAKKLKIKEQEEQRLKSQLEAMYAPREIALPERPTLEAFDYDAEQYETALISWTEKKAAYENNQRLIKEREARQQEAFNIKLQSYQAKKASYKGVDDAEAEAIKVLDLNQQGIIVNYANDPALVVLALGKNPVLLNQLSAIKDPIEYALKVKEIELKAREKMTTRKAPPPEKTVAGKSAVPKAHEKVLDRLRSEGKYGEAMQYRKKHGLI